MDRVYRNGKTFGIHDFPRLLAVSELAWTPRERREWNDFRRRINVHVSLLHARGINAFPLSDDVVITAQMLSEGKKRPG